ncbi:site-specific tyrosine recombinase XerC [Stieleria neptunia]|uniref:Site-specific tyrosine recombinase XerC n=1 Tax=Stieleria neptunia TaxID=2527979 RepID=A0A518HU60_9BACT|nr:tyrosine-type recombinase/integrase [Stieleria neptunia]QDV44385.1 site-specific tyrosine recombinase XerC [Stieleria neptunia]
MPRKKGVPSMRYHVSGQSVVTFCGRNYYLGPHDSVEAQARYHALVAEYIANGMASPPEQPERQVDSVITVRCVTGEVREHVKTKYANNKQELERFTNLCQLLEDEYGNEPAADFGPRKLSDVRELFVKSGNCRSYVNRQTRNVVAIFRHGVSRELIKPDQLVALQSLEPLRYGQTTAKESNPVTAVDIEAVRLTAQHLSPIIKAMVRIQAATGMRPSEVCKMRPCDIDQNGTEWIYRPSSHKTAHRGKTKGVPIVGDAKLALIPYMKREPEAFCFSPKEAVEWRNAQLRKNRKTKVQPSQVSRKKANPKKLPRDRYDASSYRHAIQRAAKKAGTDHWYPYQLRHTAASVVREALGVEYAQALLGHSRPSMTEHYAKLSEAVAIEAAKRAPSIG